MKQLAFEFLDSTSTPLYQERLLQPAFCKEGDDPFNTIDWSIKDAVIVGSDGKEKFRQDRVEVPSWWSDTTVNVVVEKYFRVVNGKRETSAKQMFSRVANWLRDQGIKQGVLTDIEGEIFRKDLLYMFVHGMHAFNSPVWFNMGVVDNPQCSACFIQEVDDTMTSITDLQKKEIMLFKGGSGTGSNLSSLRSSFEKLSGGGNASGPVSFMKMFDAGAGVTKSGGTTRRAAKMVVLNADHPDIMEQANGEYGFIQCKEVAETIAQDLYSTGKYSAEWNKPGNVYDLVGFQNANNSVRVTDDFMRAVKNGEKWTTKLVMSGNPHKEYEAKGIFHAMAKAAWTCGDPGIQFDTIINTWHTCKASGRINASNPCSEYMFLDDTACNLSSLNLLKFVPENAPFSFDSVKFAAACRIAIIAKEIIVEGSSYPSKEIEANSRKYRTLGLGYTNAGALLTYWGLPYDSEEGRMAMAAITSLMSSVAYDTSADLAKRLAPFSEYGDNCDYMLSVIDRHKQIAADACENAYLSKNLRNSLIGPSICGIFDLSVHYWEDALLKGQCTGFRNAQTTVIAPTGTISFLMAADTTGLEPTLAYVVYKKIVGGGLLKLPSNIVEPALRNLQYSSEDISSIVSHLSSTGSLYDAENLKPEHRKVFAEALGPNALSPEAHVAMMAAVQPYISGSISKTVNMPNDATVEQIEDIYMMAWEKGLKCIAVYRDGCKLSQPISSELKSSDKSSTKDGLVWGERRRLKEERNAVTHKFDISGIEGYLTSGIYEDGSLAEIFVRMSKQGSTLYGLIDAWAIAVSLGLQHGVPLETFIDKYQGMQFDPRGFTSNENVRIAKSIPDYIFRYLETLFKNGNEPTLKQASAHIEKSSKTDLDGPPCTNCGNLTRRAGSCYCCQTCGTTTGCS